ncbi:MULTISPECIES: DUF6766 family protein [unclassified Lysobacter]|uniref:DUF6766 family protein n=1 Tax=unclassified Lysobacter TaxID=2635362 RepID=UPI00070038FC|nr:MULTISPECIES: DUF6766 family protein [unclassified Lysobacter]KQZ57507.1 hypothetical protein ASD53_07685 [Lysobacter sp. Root559]KRC33656.1 hypothetical protein ASE10_11845 [Lysobacter sp. Root76]KRD68993.1 hypothetical protein ASE45_07295 [Lysobacter sp. Root96]
MTKTAKNTPSFWQRNALGLVLFAIFAVFLWGQILAGHASWNDELLTHGYSPVTLAAYLRSGHFISATFENWESEFLQMGMYVLLTVWLRQHGSAESRPFHEDEEVIEDGPTPWPVRMGGWWARLYASSLTIAFAFLFVGSFVLHAVGSWRHELDERHLAGQPPIGILEHLSGTTFWFESLQNWQSEFLAVLAIVMLSIFLRQDKSPESKPLAAPHSQTGA